MSRDIKKLCRRFIPVYPVIPVNFPAFQLSEICLALHKSYF